MGETWVQQQARLSEEASRAEASKISRELDMRESEINAKLGVQKTDESVPASPTAVSLRDEIRQYKETTLNDLRCSVLDNLLRDDWVSQLRNVTEQNWREKQAALRQEVADELRRRENSKNLWRRSGVDASLRRFLDHLETLGDMYSRLEPRNSVQQTFGLR
jgi:hypothetical protein